MSWGYYGFKPYVPVAERRRRAQKEVAKLAKKGKVIQPIQIDGRTIARTFWGEAWCDNLEAYSDFANRLPRGRTYVRNGSVVHLEIRSGQIEALVSGSELYRVSVQISPAAKAKWKALCQECAGAIGSVLELLQGRFSDQVMNILTRKETGLFPAPREITMKCSCPDWATLCKHVAAVLYGVGARLDQSPELLFLLRSVKPEDLIAQAADVGRLAAKAIGTGLEIAESELGSVFGIELEKEPPKEKSPAPVPVSPPAASPRAVRAVKRRKVKPVQRKGPVLKV